MQMHHVKLLHLQIISTPIGDVAGANRYGLGYRTQKVSKKLFVEKI